jgi:hypothetical protein
MTIIEGASASSTVIPDRSAKSLVRTPLQPGTFKRILAISTDFRQKSKKSRNPIFCQNP